MAGQEYCIRCLVYSMCARLWNTCSSLPLNWIICTLDAGILLDKLKSKNRQTKNIIVLMKILSSRHHLSQYDNSAIEHGSQISYDLILYHPCSSHDASAVESFRKHQFVSASWVNCIYIFGNVNIFQEKQRLHWISFVLGLGTNKTTEANIKTCNMSCTVFRSPTSPACARVFVRCTKAKRCCDKHNWQIYSYIYCIVCRLDSGEGNLHS